VNELARRLSPDEIERHMLHVPLYWDGKYMLALIAKEGGATWWLNMVSWPAEVGRA
jgi:hypothetical protein